MPGLTLYLSNRLENLADRLAETVRKPIGAPLQPETIIVQSRGMERWISMQLARRNGISANTEFPFPNAFLDSVFQRLFPDLPDTSPFEPDMLTAHIMKTLPGLVELPEFAALRRYLQDDPDRLKLFQLSTRIAGTFDQYMVFRPQMIFAWEKQADRCEPENRWQPLLWREMIRSKGDRHRTRLQRELIRHLQHRSTAQPLFSDRIHLFGISYLPPFHLQAFAAMGRVAQVNFFLLNPCKEYWADILDARDIQRITRGYTIEEETEAYYYLEQGNPLLASMGTLGRDFLALVSDTDCVISDCFSPVATDSLLTGIQSDILNLVDRAANGIHPIAETGRDSEQGKILAAGRPDGSIEIHACHSPIREIEVLHDRLLAMFDSQSDLKPHDIIVMTPDIESYAPFIHAVFGTQLDPSLQIPYSVADQSARKTSPAVNAFLQLLSFKDSRFSVSQVTTVMELPGVKERFGLSQTDLERILAWIEDVNIRWGRDADSRAAFGLPATGGNTWKAGIQRLLLGLAMQGEQQDLFAGILPYEAVEGQDAQVLGKLLDFLQQLFDWVDTLCRPCKPVRWQQRLNRLLERFFLFDGRSERDMHQIRQALERVAQLETLGGYDRELSVEVVVAFLEKCFQRRSHTSGFLSGGVTFCAMLPMRSIPFRIVCLVGMNSDAMPRNQRPLGFDLIHRHPQPGDRSRRNDDKYMFLEAILSARRTLYISYVGQSIADNSPIPPSVLVSELIETLDRGWGIDADTIVVRHPLQAFSARYFQRGGTSLSSYSRENYDAIRSRRRRRDPPMFFNSPLPEPTPDRRRLNIEQLCRFFYHPVRYLLQQRLLLRLEALPAAVQDREPFRLDWLARYKIGQTLFHKAVSGADLSTYFPVQKATGLLPQGTVGEMTYRQLQSDTEDFARRVAAEMQGHSPQQLPLDLQIAEFSLHGVLSDLYPHRRIQCRFAQMKARDILSAWIGHLCLGIAAADRHPFRSTLVTSNAILQFGRVEKPAPILEDLLRIYWKGLHAPLPFFPEFSLEFFRQVYQKGKEKADAIIALRRKWTGGEFIRGQLDDPYVRLCFERSDPFDAEFQQLAKRVYQPLVDSLAQSR